MILKRCLAQLLAFVAVMPVLAQADVRLPSVFGEHMVLQRDRPIPVWGWDEPGTRVTVKLGDDSVSGAADADGKWQVSLPAQSAGGPLAMTVTGSTTVAWEDVLVGEVWLCSGQSNMEWPVRLCDNPEEEIAAANHPRIRHIKIPHTATAEPQNDVPSDGWQICSPETVAGFTGVGYFFGRKLAAELEVPIGLIGSNWGGTRIEPWTPPVGFQSVPALQDIASKLDEYPTKKDDGSIEHQSPLALYNGMIEPLVPYALRGAIWYQGESNNGEGMLYHEKMKALIAGWRSLWQDDALPFYFVQLAPFRYGGDPLKLPGIWEAQAETLRVPYTGMAVTTDVADLDDIHPRNKQTVGDRLARWALARTYGQDDLVFSGPIYKSLEIDGSRARVAFDHVDGGLKSLDGQPLNWFTIAGRDLQFVDAVATIDGDSVIVQADSVAEPVAVRCGWHQEAEPNLANSAGLPVSPFRTDKSD